MRCPKCGYITFDHLETCTKCGKNIAAESAKLSGTVFKARVPLFLRLDELSDAHDGELTPDRFGGNEPEVEFSLEDEELMDSNVGDDDAVEEEEIVPDEIVSFDDNEDEFDLVLPSDVASEINDDAGEIELELESDQGDTATEAFRELDISDLAPPVGNEKDVPLAELTKEGVDDGDAVDLSSDYVAPPMSSDTGLEDLQTDGLDLDTPFLPPAGSSSAKKLRPAVKTGTALDDFDIDLGELITDIEE